MIQAQGSSFSRRDTTLLHTAYLQQLPIGARPGSRAWVRQALRLRVAESRADRGVSADIVKRRHYLGRWPAPPRSLLLSYLADLGTSPGEAGAAALVMVALLPGRYHAAAALDVHPCSVLSLVRSWRADDLGPELAPNLMPQVLRRAIGGCKRSGLGSLAQEWTARKLRPDGLRAAPRLLVAYADPAVGHDGGLYLGAGARACGPSAQGRLLFAWALDPALQEPLDQLAAAVKERQQ